MKQQAVLKYSKDRDSRPGRHGLGVLTISSLVPAIVLGLLLTSCAVGAYPFHRSTDISRKFENGELVPDYRYYESGPASKPIAIVAIRSDYRLQSKYWQPIDVNGNSLKALVERISFVIGSDYKEDQNIPNGARILAPDGEMVGMWYSVYDYSKITFLDDKVIYLSNAYTILPPEVRVPRD